MGPIHNLFTLTSYSLALFPLKSLFITNWLQTILLLLISEIWGLITISPLIELNEDKSFKQVRFSPRLDYVPILDKEKLDLYYQARRKLSEMYNSEKYRIEFKLEPKDLMMMDNHRLLHGRTAYETKEGERFLQGCYIDYDSTEGKLRHLKRKFNL